MATITIDDIEYTVAEGRNLIDAVAELGIDIPHFCYHPGLPADGNCRMCLTEMEIRPGQFGMVTSCTMRIKDGMNFRFNSPATLDNRKGIMEFLLINHPLDCSWCDQAGECSLQDNSFDHGRSKSRFIETKRVPPQKELGPHIQLFTTRCILCQRCTRFCDEITGTSELGIIEMGARSEIAVFDGQPLNNKMSANVADICPVGALVTKDFLYKPRIWHYEKINSVCPGCATGCNTTHEVMHQKIYRTKPRHNEEVNSYWMCDEGRFSYHDWQDLDRLKSPMKRENGVLVATTWPDAIQLAVDGLSGLLDDGGNSSVGVVGSTMMTNEENYLLKQLAELALKTSAIGLYRKPEGEEWTAKGGFRIEPDKTPNLRGASDILGTSDMQGILDGINSGDIKGLYMLGGHMNLALSESEKSTLSKLDLLVVQDVCDSDLVTLAHIALPGAIPFEKDGTITNIQGRVQRLNQVAPPPGAARLDGDILQYIGQKFNTVLGPKTPAEIMGDISEKVDDYKGLNYSMIGESGALASGVNPLEEAGG